MKRFCLVASIVFLSMAAVSAGAAAAEPLKREMVWDTADAGFTRQKAVRFAWKRSGVVEAAQNGFCANKE